MAIEYAERQHRENPITERRNPASITTQWGSKTTATAIVIGPVTAAAVAVLASVVRAMIASATEIQHADQDRQHRQHRQAKADPRNRAERDERPRRGIAPLGHDATVSMMPMQTNCVKYSAASPRQPGRPAGGPGRPVPVPPMPAKSGCGRPARACSQHPRPYPGRHHGKIRSRALRAQPGMACELVEYPTVPFRWAPLVGVRAMGKVGDTKAGVHGNVLLRRLDAFRRGLPSGH